MGDMKTSKPAAPVRNRIKDHRKVRAGDLVPHDWNFRDHPDAQKAAMAGIYREVGFARSLLAYELPDGRLKLIDGHLRRDMDPDMEVDVEVLDVTEQEAAKLLAVYDQLGGLAEVDETKLAELLKQIDLESEALRSMLETVEKDRAMVSAEEIQLEYHVLIPCATEQDQRVILEELDRNGLESKAICAGFQKPKRHENEHGAGGAAAAKVEAAGRLITRSVPIKRTARVKQLEGLFDVPPSKRAQREWRVDFTLDRPWNIGLIVGPSGSGKTTLAKELFSQQLVSAWPWPEDASIVDAFPAGMSIHDITGLLSSVGFSSPPSWLKPFHVLSNGEQFRVTLARTLAEAPDLAVVDEFTSVVDRTVAQIGSAALAKTIRTTNRRFVAVSCHYDIEEWLQPDWKYDTASGQFLWRSLRRRPSLEIKIRRVDSSWWKLFAHHHYLSTSLHRSAKCFLAEVAGRPAAFASVLHNMGRVGWWREHRTVCLPDFQGVGLGNALSEFVAGLFMATGKEYRSTTSHPAMIRHRCASRLWRMVRAPAVQEPGVNLGAGAETARLARTASWDRPTAGFQFVGEANVEDAKRFGVI